MVDLDSKKKVLEKGGQVHIGKPFSANILELQINNLLNRQQEKAEQLMMNLDDNEGMNHELSEDESGSKR